MFRTTVEQTTDDGNGAVKLPRNYQPTPTEVDAAEKLRSYEVRVRYNAPVEGDSTVDGRLYRWAGVLEVVPRINAITVRLATGAREHDLVFMLAQVQQLQAGHWNALRLVQKRSPRDGHIWWRTTLGHAVRPRLGGFIEPCTVQACAEHGKHHVATVPGDVWHEAEAMEHRDGWYSLKAVRYRDEPWKLNVDVHDDLDARASADLANDLAWTQAAIAKLNSTQVERTLEAELLAHGLHEHVGGAGRA